MRLRLSDLSPGITYALQLRTNTGDAVSDWSRVFSLTTSSDTIAPNTPTGVAGTMDGTSFNLSWNKVTASADGTSAADLDHYEVLVSSTGTGTTGLYLVNDVKFQFTLDLNRTLFGSPRANIIMAVRAVDKNGNASSYSSNVSQTNAAPAAPANFTATPAVDSIILKWDAVADTDLIYYRVYSGTTSGAQTTLVWQGPATGATIASTAYLSDRWYKVAAVDVFGTETTTPPVAGPVRPNSTLATDTTPPAVPTGLAATLTTASDTTTSAAISWTAVTDTDGDLAGYQIGYRPVGASDWQYTTVDYTVTSTRIDRLTPYVNYDFRIRSYDYQANYSAWSSTVTTTTAAVNTAPSTPSTPTAAASTMKVQVTLDGLKAAGGAMEPDVSYYEVYISSASGFTPGPTNMVGRIGVGPAMIQDFYIPLSAGSGTTQTIYVKVIAVDQLGLKSSASAQATATPSLIGTANIGDAVITNAKIGSVVADKITAGSGFINDIIVKSKFTLGDASNTGVIESYGYVAGTTGFHFDKSLLEINQGLISAAALKLQNSPNLVPPEYADFEYPNVYYIDPFWLSGGQAGAYSNNAIVDISTAAADRFKGKQGLVISMPFNTSAMSAYFGKSTTDYNVSVEPGKTYIVSMYMRNFAPNTETWNVHVKGDNAADLVTTPYALGASEAALVRRSFAVTIPSGVNKVLLWVEKPGTTNSGSLVIDCVQVEEKTGADNTPSPWRPPGSTTLDGYGIRTGQIISSGSIIVGGVTVPSWSVNTQGNMQIGDALVRGRLIVGTGNEDYPNRAPSNGDFETNVTGYNVHQVGATGTAIVRTTTGGEVISGTGSAKVTAAAGSKTALGVSFPTAATYQPGTTVRARANIKTNATAGTLVVTFYNSSAVAMSTQTIVTSPVSGTVYSLDATYNIDTGENVAFIAFYNGGTTTATSVIVDDVIVNVDTDIPASYVASAGFIPGEGGYGWQVDGQGNAEFNTGVFRGSLGAGIVTADTLASTLTISSVFRTADTGRRVEFSQDGIILYRSDNSVAVSLPTDDELTASVDGDFLAQSLTVSDSMAIRGSTNELSRGATLTIQSGTTAPNSPPQIGVDWNTLTYSADGFESYRFGVAVQGGYFRVPCIVYSVGTIVESYNMTTGAKVYGSLQTGGSTGMWNVWGGITAIGNNVYLLGTNAAGNWRIMGFTFTTAVSGTPTKFLDVSYPHSTDHLKPAIGNDGTQLVIAYCNKNTGLMSVRNFSATTGTQIGGTINSPIQFSENMAFVNKGTFDGAYGGSSVYVVASRNSNYAYVLDGTLTNRLAKWDFPLISKPTGQTFSGGKFYTYDGPGHRFTEHTDIVWDNTVAGNSTWYAVNTWYNTDATNGNKETSMGPLKSFTMKQRSRLTITSPPIPIRPTPNTVDDATAVGVYLARGTTTPVRTKMERQGYLADGVRTVTYSTASSITIPAVGVNSSFPPPATSNYPGSSPATLKSDNSRFIVNGDGSGTWSDIVVDTAGALTIASRLPTKYASGTVSAPALAAGASQTLTVTFGVTFPSAPKVFYSPASSRITYSVNNVTTTGCDINVSNWSPGSSTTQTTQWIAIL